MKANPTKCNFLLSLEAITRICLEHEHVSNLCDKANKKVNALARIFPLMPLE